jgi:hypothetical protein
MAAAAVPVSMMSKVIEGGKPPVGGPESDVQAETATAPLSIARCAKSWASF